MRLAIYGGSFNPPHLGHVHVAKSAVEALNLDRLLILPDNIPPHKQMATGSPGSEDRLAMCQLAFGGIHRAEVSDMEIRRGGLSYTSDTVHELRESYPEAELFLIIGTDMLTSFTEWHLFEEILRSCTLAVVRRENSGVEEAAAEALRSDYGACIEIIDVPALPVSSTEIRQSLAEGRKPALLSKAVFHYITAHHLYQT